MFCDDVRVENNGKIMYIGVYKGDMIVPDTPFTWSHLNAVLKVVTPCSKPIQTLDIRVTFGGRELLALEVPEADLKSLFDSASAMIDEKHEWIEDNDPSDLPPMSIAEAEFRLSLSPFVAEQEGVLRVIVNADGERLRLPGLRIRAADND